MLPANSLEHSITKCSWFCKIFIFVTNIYPIRQGFLIEGTFNYTAFTTLEISNYPTPFHPQQMFSPDSLKPIVNKGLCFLWYIFSSVMSDRVVERASLLRSRHNHSTCSIYVPMRMTGPLALDVAVPICHRRTALLTPYNCTTGSLRDPRTI